MFPLLAQMLAEVCRFPGELSQNVSSLILVVVVFCGRWGGGGYFLTTPCRHKQPSSIQNNSAVELKMVPIIAGSLRTALEGIKKEYKTNVNSVLNRTVTKSLAQIIRKILSNWKEYTVCR